MSIRVQWFMWLKCLRKTSAAVQHHRNIWAEQSQSNLQVIQVVRFFGTFIAAGFDTSNEHTSIPNWWDDTGNVSIFLWRTECPAMMTATLKLHGSSSSSTTTGMCLECNSLQVLSLLIPSKYRFMFNLFQSKLRNAVKAKLIDHPVKSDETKPQAG